MATGKVKWFSKSKGYGFIEDEAGGPDIFVHHTGIIEDPGGYAFLNDGETGIIYCGKGRKGFISSQRRN